MCRLFIMKSNLTFVNAPLNFWVHAIFYCTCPLFGLRWLLDAMDIDHFNSLSLWSIELCPWILTILSRVALFIARIFPFLCSPLFLSFVLFLWVNCEWNYCFCLLKGSLAKDKCPWWTSQWCINNWACLIICMHKLFLSEWYLHLSGS